MKTILKYLSNIKDIVLVGAILVLLLIISTKNVRIDNLNKKLAEKPKIEFKYSTLIDTIHDTIPKPYIVKVDSFIIDSIEKNLSGKDSAEIAQTYLATFKEYSTKRTYSKILKNDSLAFAKIEEVIQYNKLQNRKFIYQDKTPVIYKTEYKTKYEYTTSIVGGIEAGLGGAEVGLGLITKRNNFYKLSYDPYNKGIRGGVYIPIFNIKSHK